MQIAVIERIDLMIAITVSVAAARRNRGAIEVAVDARKDGARRIREQGCVEASVLYDSAVRVGCEELRRRPHVDGDADADFCPILFENRREDFTRLIAGRNGEVNRQRDSAFVADAIAPHLPPRSIEHPRGRIRVESRKWEIEVIKRGLRDKRFREYAIP